MREQTKQIVETSKELLKLYGYFIDRLWHIEDVHLVCEQKNLPKLSDNEAMEVFYVANDQFGEVGFGWLQLEVAVNYYIIRKKLKNEMLEMSPA